MEWRRTIRRLPLAGAAAAGAAVGHSIAYLMVAPEGRERAVLLAGTGHGYWSTAVAAEIVLGILAAVTTVVHHFSNGLRSTPRPASEKPWAWLAARLALLQIVIFAVQEVVERVASGNPAFDVVHSRLLLVGVLVQVLVALLVATLLVWIGRAAEAVGRALGRFAFPRPVQVRVPRPLTAGRPTSRPRGVRGIRAPPRPHLA